MSEGELPGIYHGTVVDNTDPDVLGRVRALIPGVVEPATAWAFPDGTLGGGSAGRGHYFVPEVGADVTVQFIMGDPDFAVYRSGWWGKPSGNTEVPTFLAGMSPSDAPQVRIIETKEHMIVLDDRSGHERLIIKNKTTGKKILIGDEGATEPFVLGNKWKTDQDALYDGIAVLTVSTAVGPSSVPINAATFTALKALTAAKLSTNIFGK